MCLERTRINQVATGPGEELDFVAPTHPSRSQSVPEYNVVGVDGQSERDLEPARYKSGQSLLNRLEAFPNIGPALACNVNPQNTASLPKTGSSH